MIVRRRRGVEGWGNIVMDERGAGVVVEREGGGQHQLTRTRRAVLENHLQFVPDSLVKSFAGG